MKRVYLLPFAAIALDLGAALVYARAHDWRHAAYWLLCGLIVVAVTF